MHAQITSHIPAIWNEPVNTFFKQTGASRLNSVAKYLKKLLCQFIGIIIYVASSLACTELCKVTATTEQCLVLLTEREYERLCLPCRCCLYTQPPAPLLSTPLLAALTVPAYTPPRKVCLLSTRPRLLLRLQHCNSGAGPKQPEPA